MSKKNGSADSKTEILDLYDKHHITIKGARTNNLKNIDLVLPKNKLIVVTGVSGSGKSSLTMDTLYAEGQRRYVESLSSYARQFMTRIKKPDIDYIKGISPAIAILQKVSSANIRSTVGTMTELFDYIRLMYARIGKTISPVSGREVKKDSVTDIVNFISRLSEDTRVIILAPVEIDSQTKDLKSILSIIEQKGYSRIWIDDEVRRIDELDIVALNKRMKSKSDKLERIFLVIDRVIIKQDDEENVKRIADSLNTALTEGLGQCSLLHGEQMESFSTRFELDGIQFMEPSVPLFNFNNSAGACPICEGYGMAIGIDSEKVVPNKQKSLFDHAIAPWSGEKGAVYYQRLIKFGPKEDIPMHTPYMDLTSEQKEKIWQGTASFDGIYSFFKELESNSYKIQDRVILSRYRGRTVCQACQGKRLRPESLYVKVDRLDIAELTDLDVISLYEKFETIKLTPQEEAIVARIKTEISIRLKTMVEIGLGYLTLQRPASTLSGGETQRIHLTRLLGNNLTGSMYLLDEPSVGLHPRDTNNLIKALKKLRDLGNTVIVVEHEEEVIKQADYLVDIGPDAGIYGGEVVFEGNYKDIIAAPKGQSMTIDYLLNTKQIPVPAQRRVSRNFLFLKEVSIHNLVKVDVKIPLHAMVCVTGVSGSGKSSLIKSVLYPTLTHAVNENLKESSNSHILSLKGDIPNISQVEMIDQQPIGKSSRSNPVTYVKAYDYIRDLYTAQPLSKLRGFKPKHFSFNVEGGRCETCKGDGVTVVDMQFLADVTLTCEECKGNRFKQEILDVKYRDKNIFDVLEMDIQQAVDFFKDQPEIINRLSPLNEIGLGYVRLGQSSSSLSGGEAQRVKLASFLTKENRAAHTVFIFDEPTTGLHFEDVRKLLIAFEKLIERGNSVIIVEHNGEVIKCADYVIDIGPEGGRDGGRILYQGPPEGLKEVKESHTAEYLKV